MLVPIIVLYICDLTLGHNVLSKPNYDIKNARNHFEDFIVKHNKNYIDEEEREKRFEIFKENLEEINKLNRESEHAVFDINQFSDLTKDEFVNQFTGLRQDLSRSGLPECRVFSDDDIKEKVAPETEFDWRKQNAVTKVKNQAQCGSCWAQSVTGVIEGQLAIKHNVLVPLSVQQLLDCTEGNGCSGGSPERALSTLIEEGGQMSEADYIYVEEKKSCKFVKSKVVVNVTECHEYDLKNEDKLKKLLYATGPLAVCLNSRTLHNYNGGILMYDDCVNGAPDHAVVLVGYGTEGGIPYWIVKNSYGEGWGEDGYFRIQYGKNTCALMASSMLSAIVE